jgi:predicted metal-dependent HD superfamily phosphohydrolase
MLTENLKDILCFQWQHTTQIFDVNPVAANQVFNHLVTAYSRPHRHYHTLQHIYHVLAIIDTLQIYAQELPSLQLAAWFHDVVYNTHADDNEEKSADDAGQMLNNLGIPSSNITKVIRLILHTKNHIGDDIDSQVLLDADLAILATHPTQYQEYATAIRQEYSWVKDRDYITGRRKVLEKFLERSHIYFTPLMFKVGEQSARANLQAEISTKLTRNKTVKKDQN